MSNEVKKDLVEATAGVLIAAASVTAASAAALPGLLGIAWQQHQNRRVQKWWDYLSRGATNPKELEARVLAGLLEDDANTIAGIVEGARAAVAAIDLAAVPIIAQLTRRYCQENDLPRWFLRGSLVLFEDLDAGEIKALRRFIADLKDIDAPSITAVARVGRHEWQAFPTAEATAKTKLSPFEEPVRLFAAIKRTGLGHDSGGYGIGGAPEAIVIERTVIDWLHSALDIID
jgi:hypothetical protein